MSESHTTHIGSGTMIRLILLIFLTYILFILRDVLLLVLVSIVIASFVEAGVHAFAQYKINRNLSVPIIFTIAILLVAGIFYAFVPIVMRELSDMLALLFKYLPSSGVDKQSIDGATQLVTDISKQSSLTELLANIKTSASLLSQGATSFIGSTFGGLLNMILVVVMSFYLSIQEKGIDTFLRILTPAKHEKYVIDLWSRTQRKIGLWFKGQLLLGLIVGATVFVVLALLGVKYAFLIGVISGIAELVPFGIIFAAIPAILFAVIDGGLLLGVKVLIFYIVIQQIESYVLSPVVAKPQSPVPASPVL